MDNPRQSDPPVRATATEARAGSTPRVARYVLVVGTLLVIIILAVIVLVDRA